MCFSYAFDQSDSNLFVKKIWGTASFFFFRKMDQRCKLP